jgi:hypothetical protein
VFLCAGDKVRAWLTRGWTQRAPDPDSRIRQVTDRYGAKGLGLVGPILPGVTASVAIGLSLARWMWIGIAVMFALLRRPLVLVEVFGVE